MPKLYEYYGLVILFYANEHEPVYVHAKSQGREARAEFVIVDGRIQRVRFEPSAGTRAAHAEGDAILPRAGARTGRGDCPQVDRLLRAQ